MKRQTIRVPNEGDIIRLQYIGGVSKTIEHLAIVLTPSNYNQQLGVMRCSPINSEQTQTQGLFVALANHTNIAGVVDCRYVNTVNLYSPDYQYGYIETVPSILLNEILARIVSPYNLPFAFV